MDGLPYPAQGNIIDAGELKSQGEAWNDMQIVLSRGIAGACGGGTQVQIQLAKRTCRHSADLYYQGLGAGVAGSVGDGQRVGS